MCERSRASRGEATTHLTCVVRDLLSCQSAGSHSSKMDLLQERVERWIEQQALVPAGGVQ